MTFTDPGVPGSVMRVVPGDLQATLGPGVSWRRRSLAIVAPSEPITRGIEQRLPWLVGKKTFLDGERYGSGKTIASRLDLGDFLRSGF